MPMSPLGRLDGRRILTRALRAGSLTDFERELIGVLRHDLFRRVDGLASHEHCQLVYRRLRYLRAHLDLGIDRLLDDPQRLVALHEWTSVVDPTLTTLATIHFNLCIGSIRKMGGERPELRSILAELDRMDSIGVFLATELGYGNNVQALQTRAEYDPSAREFVLTTGAPEAQKFMPNTGAEGIAKIAVVLAQLHSDGRNHGVFPFLVRIRTADGLCPGVQVTPLGDKPDYPLDNAITAFHGVRVPLAHWLSGPESRLSEDGRFESEVRNRGARFLMAMDRVQMGKVCLSGAAVSMQAAGLRVTLEYAQQRKTFAPGRRASTLLAYRTYQRAVFESVARHYACAFMLRRTVDVCSGRDAGADGVAQRLMALTKVLCSYEGLHILAQCRERLGAQGMFCANRVLGYWIGTNGIVTAEGDNEILLTRAGRELLQGQAYTPPAIDGPCAELIESPDYLLSLIRRRETALHRQLVDLAKVRAPSGSIFDAWNEYHGQVIALARVHTQRLALEAFDAQVRACDDAWAGDVLDKLMRLYGLCCVADAALPLIVDGALSHAHAAALDGERARLCAELGPHAGALQEAFGIPVDLIDTPLGGDYIQAYDRLGESEPPRNSFFRTLVPAAPQGEAPSRDRKVG